MSATRQTGKQSFSSTPTFDARGDALIQTLSNQIQRDPSQSAAGQFFTGAMNNGMGGDLTETIRGITAASDAALPQELAAARSFTRNRPDTFGEQTAMNVTQDNRISRDLQIANLLREQGNMDQMFRSQAAGQLAGLDSTRVGEGAALLSLLRGEQGYGRESGNRVGITPK